MKRLILTLLAPAAILSAQTSTPPPKAPVVPDEIPPKIQTLVPGVTLTMLAEHPDLVTPTGVDVADDGSIYLIACHTHSRHEGYVGPAQD